MFLLSSRPNLVSSIIQNMKIDPQAAYLLKRFDKAGFEAYLVGGCVRDLLRNTEPKDWDIATAARPEQVYEILNDLHLVATGIQYGTVTAVLAGTSYEITSFRNEGPYLDGRRPSSVSFTTSIYEDLARRDFTINALAYHPKHGLIDPFDGMSDLERGILQTVGEPTLRLNEDALRIMRALRFSSTLGFEIAPALKNALHELRSLLAHIAPERIRDELMKLLVGSKVLSILLEYSDVLAVPIPEIEPTIEHDQRSVYHMYDIWQHTAYAVDFAVPDPLVRLTLLFHDFGKPSHFTVDADGHGHFYGHDIGGAKIAAARLHALRFDNKTIHMVSNLIKWHSVQLNTTNVVRWLNRLGADGVKALLEVKRGDILAHSEINRQSRMEQMSEVERALTDYLEQEPCFTRAALAIDGDDLIELGMREGPRIGRMLDALLDEVLDGKLENKRDVLLEKTQLLLS